MSDVLIEFLAQHATDCPPPYPASKMVPEWLKQMPLDFPTALTPNEPTVKQCMPLIDAMTSGYIIPMPADAHFSMDAAGVFQAKSTIASPGFRFHSREQVQGAPFEKCLLVKFPNPWIIRTPPGYSTLFLSPINQVSMPFSFFGGVVDTDRFHWPVNFPAICNMARDTNCVVPRGAPLMQVIPFKRENWISRDGVADPQEVYEFQRELILDHPHYYRDALRAKKRYS